MTIASTASTDLTVDDVVSMAYESIAMTDAQGDVDGTLLVKGRRWLFVVLQALSKRGLILRAREMESRTIVANQAYVDMTSDTLSVEGGATLRNEDGITDRMLEIWSFMRYQEIPNKTVTGVPNAYSPQQQSDGSWRVYLYPVPPDTTWSTLLVPRARRPRDVEDGSVTLDFDRKWLLTVIKELGAILARKHGRAALALDVKEEAREERAEAEDDETERGGVQFCFSPTPWD